MNSTTHHEPAKKAKIWIDLDNSPHVPFFAPIINELENRGYSIVLTARDAFQVRELADLLHLHCKLVGRHNGKSKIRKVFGLCFRALQLIPIVLREKPDLAISHGSRSQLIVCAGLRIPSLLIIDYECAKRLGLILPTWFMCPEVIPASAFECDPKRVLKYPGIKEDVYVPRFIPDPRIRPQLGLSDDDLVVTIRPPATEAHYHRPQSDELFEAAIEFLSQRHEVKIVVLPRNEKQAIHLKNHWPGLFSNRKIRIPEQVVDGLNLIWHSDLVISGGGTMNREAAALGVPVYSTFRGEIGAVDRYLSDRGRLVLLESVQDLQSKIQLVRRSPAARSPNDNDVALSSIVNQVVAIAGTKTPVSCRDSCLGSTAVHQPVKVACKMRILSVVGARPNFMKAAPIIRAINWYNNNVFANSTDDCRKAERIEHILVHTGQHYDDFMSGSFFSDLKLPKPDIHLGVGTGSQTVQTAEIMMKFETVLCENKPHIVVVVGDVTSTVACALVAAKMSFDSAGSRPLIAHVEAGLRSFDRSMPEEINRIVTDHLSDLLFVTEPSGLQNLRNEGVSAEKIHFVGNTMIDSLLAFKQSAEASPILEELALRTALEKNEGHHSIRRYALLTLHRPSNVDHRDSFLRILAGLEELATECPIIFPIHPRTRSRVEEFDLQRHLCTKGSTIRIDARGAGSSKNGIILTQPLGYLDFLCLMMHASIVVTDSGGIQEETTCLGIPCVTVRENTERPVTVEIGTNVLSGKTQDGIKDAIRRQTGRKLSGSMPEKWDGQAATRIVDVLVRMHRQSVLPEQLIPEPSVRQLMPVGTFD